jgi:serine/threonine protein kinase
VRQNVSGNEIDRNTIILEREIGHGEYGVVMKATATALPGTDAPTAVAVKVVAFVDCLLRLKVLKNGHSESDATAFLREGNRLSDLHHPNIVELIGVCFSSTPLMMVLEYLPHGLCLIKT